MREGFLSRVVQLSWGIKIETAKDRDGLGVTEYRREELGL